MYLCICVFVCVCVCGGGGIQPEMAVLLLSSAPCPPAGCECWAGMRVLQGEKSAQKARVAYVYECGRKGQCVDAMMLRFRQRWKTPRLLQSLDMALVYG